MPLQVGGKSHLRMVSWLISLLSIISGKRQNTEDDETGILGNKKTELDRRDDCFAILNGD